MSARVRDQSARVELLSDCERALAAQAQVVGTDAQQAELRQPRRWRQPPLLMSHRQNEELGFAPRAVAAVLEQAHHLLGLHLAVRGPSAPLHLDGAVRHRLPLSCQLRAARRRAQYGAVGRPRPVRRLLEHVLEVELSRLVRGESLDHRRAALRRGRGLHGRLESSFELGWHVATRGASLALRFGPSDRGATFRTLRGLFCLLGREDGDRRADVVKRRGPVQPDLALARHAKPEHRDMPHAVRERAHPRQAQCLADRLAQRAREQTGEGQVCFELELEPRVYRSRARRVRLDQTAQRALQRRGSDAREARAPHAVGCEARQTTKHFEDDRFTLEIARGPEAHPAAPVRLTREVLAHADALARGLGDAAHLGTEELAEVTLARLANRRHELERLQVAAHRRDRKRARFVARRREVTKAVVHFEQAVAARAPIARR